MTLADRIRSDIERRIAAGEWSPGYKIPFEHELVTEYGCARATVGKAMTALARAGLIERRRKAGSFVAFPHVQSAVLDIPDIGGAIAKRTGSYQFELKSSAMTNDDRGADFDRTTPLRHVVGIHHGRDGPFAVEDRVISLTAVPEAADADFATTAPSAWLLESVPWTEARHRISAIGASGGVSSWLAVARHFPCLLVERWTWRAGTPITFVRQTFPGDRFDLVATFTPTGQ